MISDERNCPKDNFHMVQYGVWPNCCNDCEFCLRLNRDTYSKADQIRWLDLINENIKTIDWTKFAYGISLLGGELYYITDKEVQDHFHSLIDTIIEYVLMPNPDYCKYSTVTNGLYNPKFLYSIIDKIRDAVGIHRVDMNFSYDLKYRYKNERSRLLVLKNINDFHNRYNYTVGVQMILTQNVINLWKAGKFDVNEFINSEIPGNLLSFLYPHEVHSGKVLDDFFFKRSDFLKFIQYLKKNSYQTYLNFINSTKNSATFKYTGLRNRIVECDDIATQQPLLSDGKEEISESCGHSTLYRCYSDSDKCILCDLKLIDPDL